MQGAQDEGARGVHHGNKQRQDGDGDGGKGFSSLPDKLSLCIRNETPRSHLPADAHSRPGLEALDGCSELSPISPSSPSPPPSSSQLPDSSAISLVIPAQFSRIISIFVSAIKEIDNLLISREANRPQFLRRRRKAEDAGKPTDRTSKKSSDTCGGRDASSSQILTFICTYVGYARSFLQGPPPPASDTHTNHLIQSSRKLITCHLQMTPPQKANSLSIERLPQIIYRPGKKSRYPNKKSGHVPPVDQPLPRLTPLVLRPRRVKVARRKVKAKVKPHGTHPKKKKLPHLGCAARWAFHFNLNAFFAADPRRAGGGVGRSGRGWTTDNWQSEQSALSDN